MFSMIPIQDLIKHLREDSLPYSPKLLVQFSDLDTKSLSLFKDQWLSIQLERRRAFVRGLADLAETDPLQLLEDPEKSPLTIPMMRSSLPPSTCFLKPMIIA